MPKKRIVVALGRNAFGKTLPEQKTAVKEAAKAIADLAELKYQIVITHSNGPQVGMIHMAMTEFEASIPNLAPAYKQQSRHPIFHYTKPHAPVRKEQLLW